MDKHYKPDNLYQNYISSISMPDLDFIIHYSEWMSDSVIEFMHFHPMFEIYYVTEGNLQIYVHDHIETLSEKEIIYIAPDIKHYVLHTPGKHWKYFVLIFEIVPRSGRKFAFHSMEAREIICQLDQIQQENYILLREPFDGEHIIRNIEKEQQEKKIGWVSTSNFLFWQFVILSLRHINNTHSAQECPDGTLNLGLEASKFIHMNYQNDITIDSVAKYLNIAPRHVNRVFQSLFGTTFSRTLSILRMEYAKNYLYSTSYSVEKIASMVGFNSPATLRNLIRQEEGLSIREFRRKYSINIEIKEQT